MYLRQEHQEKLINSINQAIKDTALTFNISNQELPTAVIEVPRDSSMGDLACPSAMQLAKVFKKPPRIIAEEIVKHLNKNNLAINEIKIEGPGFINFKFENTYLNETINEVLDLKENFGKAEAKQKRINVEYVSANPTGPMHVGNARGGAIGDVLANLFTWAGNEVEREFYINDAGNQIEKLKDSLEVRYQQIQGEDISLSEDHYQGKDLIDNVRGFLGNLSEQEKEDLKKLSPEDRSNQLAQFTIENNLINMKKDLNNYGVNYDVWFSENSLYQDNQIKEVLKILEENDKTYIMDDAIWFKSTDYGLEKDDVLVRNNGIPTYFLGDIAYHYNKFKKRHFDLAIDVWGADHYGHVARLKAAMEALGIDSNRLHIVLMQLVKLMSNGKEIKISKRTGEMITLKELIQDIGYDASRLFFNLRSPESHLVFDLDLAIQDSNENPVFYIQYAYARICSILRKLEIKDSNFDLNLLKESEEIQLINLLSKFPEEIIIATNNYDPSRITHYAIDLAAAFHRFYNNCRVNIDDLELKKARIALIKAVRQVLKNTMSILNITAPEKM